MYQSAMFIKVLIPVCIHLLFPVFSFGQCPDRARVWKRLIFLRDSSTLSPSEKLKELLYYEDRIKSCVYQFDSTHALLLQRIGATYFYETDYLKAARYMQQSINMINTNAGNPSINIKHNIRNYYSLGWICDSLNNVTQKMKCLDSCIALAMKYNTVNSYLVSSLLAKVEYFFNMGDYQHCIDYATICERYTKEYAGKAEKNEYFDLIDTGLRSLLWKVNALLILKDDETAERLLTNKADECKRAGLKDYLATIYSQLAEVHLYRRDAQKALLNYQLALKCAAKTGYDVGCKVILNNIGYNIHFRYFNDDDRALFYCKKALYYINRNKLEKSTEAIESVDILNNIANIYVRKQLYDSAFYYFRLAFRQIRTGADETSLLNTSSDEFVKQGKMHYLTGLVIDKGDAFKHQYEPLKKTNLLNQALNVYKVADQLLDKVRLNQSELKSKLFWRADSRRLYENAIDACYLLGNTKDAFYFFEKSRAVLLNDQLSRQRWMGETDILKQTQLKKQILRLEKELSRADADGNKIIITEIFSKKQELDFLEQQIKTANPLYYQSFLDTGFITVKNVQQVLLKEHHALLEIFSGDRAVYALLVTANNNYLTKINKQDYENVTLKFISYLSDAGLMNRKFNDFVKTAADLYQLIFRNLPVPGNRIIVSPDGQYFPFEALVTSRPGQPPAWFLNDHAVSYTYSARFLMNDFTSPPPTTGKNFMGIAPVSYPASFSLAALPGSDQSLHTISAYFDHAVTYIAADASMSNFTEQFSKYQVIQLYTHAADSSENKEPVIYFADSALYLSDLINVHKPFTRLIVLSACQTAKGKNYHGEGIFSFNRGFAALGVPAAIANLWSVDNASTYLLTELFYKHLVKGLPTDMALQKAKLEFLNTASKERSMPCYWAGPVLIGKTDTLAMNNTYSLEWIIIFAGLSCIVIGAITKWFIKKHKAKA